MNFADTLHPASWRGVPFGLELGSATFGRRKVQHDYPYRDTVWLEDQGRLPRSFRLQGFLIGNSAVYGGGDVKSQRARMEAAAEATGPGILVHPSRGRLTVDLFDLVVLERWDEGNYFELQFTFVQGGAQLFPAIFGAFGALVGEAAALADLAGLGSFVDAIAGPLQQGLDAATSMATTASQWLDQAQGLARDATSLYGTLSQLGGANYGRYFNGRNSGFLEGLSSRYAGASSIKDLTAAGAAQRAQVTASAAGVTSAIAGLGVTSTTSDVAAAVQSAVAAVQACAADPADGIRTMVNLADFKASGPTAGSAAGKITSRLFQTAAATAAARVSAAYAPSSADDATATRAIVLAPIAVSITAAGQVGDDPVYSAMRSLRKTVVQDLAERGGALAGLVAVELPGSLPDLVVAQRLYGDAGRSDELVTQANPIHPLFMPRGFKALAS